jgi:hypothetical protein
VRLAEIDVAGQADRKDAVITHRSRYRRPASPRRT